MEAATQTQSFAQQHAEPSKGFNAVPRWFRRTAWWKTLRAEHRAIIDELYHQIRRLPLLRSEMSFDIGTNLKRGQCAISLDKLAEASGATKQQVRTALQHAEKAGVIRHDSTRARAARSTHPFSLFTWLDFDLYDIADTRTNTSVNTSDNTTPNTTTNITTNTNNTQSSIHILGDKENTRGRREVPSAPPPVRSAQGEAPVSLSPAGRSGRPRKSNTSPAVKTRLTDEQVACVQSSSLAMAGYYLHGADSIGVEPQAWASLQPTSTHWSPNTQNIQVPDPNATDAQLAAYVWCRTQNARQTIGQPLERADFPRLVGVIARLRQSKLTQAELVAIADTVGARWSDITRALSWMSSPPLLNETFLANDTVRALAGRIARGETTHTHQHRNVPQNLSPAAAMPSLDTRINNPIAL